MPKKLLIFFVFILVLIWFKFFYLKNFNNQPSLIINNKTLYVEIADNNITREQGLSGKKNLDDNKGMLFLFPSKNYYGFWMKDMNFPLDFIWIDGYKVVDITINVTPEGNFPKRLYYPKSPVDKVLEIKAGMANSLNIKINDKIKFELNK